jgi:cytochrome bd-type quinol oxidase subunit 1
MSAALLAVRLEDRNMRYALIAQVLFYGLAVTGRLLSVKKRAPLLFYLPFYFTWMHAAALTGWMYYATGRQPILWHKAGRENKFLKK